MVSSSTTSAAVMPIKDFIILAACGVNELLPMNPGNYRKLPALVIVDLPADVFTSCLTTPIVMALRWYVNFSETLSYFLAGLAVTAY
jgi:regulator-associated protein of mTOR